jgi:hypothetical protein
LCVTVVDVATTGPTGATNGAIGSGVIAFLTEVVLTTAGALEGTIRIQIGAWGRFGGAGVTNRHRDALQTSFAYDPERRHAVKTATDRAAEAIEAAEKIFADEMGATLDLTAAAKTLLIATISSAIQAAIAEERQRLTPAL